MYFACFKYISLCISGIMDGAYVWDVYTDSVLYCMVTEGIEKGKIDKTRGEHMDTCQSSIHCAQSTYDSIPHDGLTSESLKHSVSQHIVQRCLHNWFQCRGTSQNIIHHFHLSIYS